MISKIGIEEFLTLSVKHPVLDVRSPGEYAHACIPGAYSLPLFSDEERKVVGTAYKQQGREQAIKIGLDYFGVKMRAMVEAVEEIAKSARSSGADMDGIDEKTTVLVHCWRGGMRSAGVAWLLDLYGFRVYTLAGGYKAFRNFVLRQFEKQYTFRILGGYTGSGKTDMLREFESRGQAVIDLEGIAHHKGSAFGDLGELKQPSPEMFENILALKLRAYGSRPVWLEDESRRIGDINMPLSFWNAMRGSPVYFLDIPFEERLKYITASYGQYRKEDLIDATTRIRKRLGGLNTKNVISFLNEDNYTGAFRILLAYYDKFYAHGLNNRDQLDELLTVIPCEGVDAKSNSVRVLAAATAGAQQQ